MKKGKKNSFFDQFCESIRNPNKKRNEWFLQLEKVRYSPKYLSNESYISLPCWMRERERWKTRDRANLETMLARVTRRYVGVWTTAERERNREREREILFGHFSRDYCARPFVCLPTSTLRTLSLSLFLSLGRLVFNPRRTPLMNLEKITGGG